MHTSLSRTRPRRASGDPMPLRPPVTAEIYIVDDDPEVGLALGRLLRSGGLAVESFTSAEAFLFEHPAPQAGVLILDVRMPGIDGPHMQAILNARGAAMPVLFLSAVDDPRIHEEVMARGAAGWLTKPVEGEVLLARVAELLAASGSSRT